MEPPAATTVNEIAEVADFFSFGTNDLTQTCLGLSRDDSAGFMGDYQENDVFAKNPFAAIAQDVCPAKSGNRRSGFPPDFELPSRLEFAALSSSGKTPIAPAPKTWRGGAPSLPTFFRAPSPGHSTR